MSNVDDVRDRLANRILKADKASHTHLMLALLIEEIAGVRDELANVAAAVDRIPDNSVTEMAESLRNLVVVAERVEHDTMFTRFATSGP